MKTKENFNKSDYLETVNEGEISNFYLNDLSDNLSKEDNDLIESSEQVDVSKDKPKKEKHKKQKSKKQKAKKIKKEKKIKEKLSYQSVLFRFSVFSISFSSFWLVSYIICIILRSLAFSSAQSSMAAGGYSVYSVQVSSPFFSILKLLAFLVPLILIVWFLIFAKAEKNNNLCNKKIIISTFLLHFIVSVFIALDVLVYHMIFI